MIYLACGGTHRHSALYTNPLSDRLRSPLGHGYGMEYGARFNTSEDH
jgi:hypothetical protein